MKRALPLLVLGTLGLSANALAAGPAIIGSLFAADVEAAYSAGTIEASPDGLSLEIRQPLNKNFWIGAAFTTSLTGDSVSATEEAELGDAITFNLGLQHEFAHNMAIYGYIGYGTGEITFEDTATPANSGSIDGKSVAWGLGLNFGIGDHLLVDAGYASLFDGDMEDSSGTVPVTIAGPRVGMGYRF